MFTGLVQTVGVVTGVRPLSAGGGGPGAVRIEIDPGSWDHVPGRGDSICMSGVCLTVVNEPRGERDAGSGVFQFDAIPETLAKTRLGGLRPGDRVNLEHAATLATFLGGHIVQGHVDGVATVHSVQRGDDWRVHVELPLVDDPDADLGQYVVQKGSICLDGVSLTIAAVWRGMPGKDDEASRVRGLTVALIPATLELTTLATLAPGDRINVEVDMMAKTVVNYTRAYLRSLEGGRVTR